MKIDTKLNKVSQRLLEILKEAQLTPSQVRYVFKLIRQEGNYQVPNVPKALKDYLSPAEIHQLLLICIEEPFDNTLIEFMIKTGLRVAEVTNLQVGHIDFQNLQLKVVQGKGKKDRFVPIASSIASKIKMMIQDKRPNDYVFSKKDGTKYVTRSLQYKVKYWLNELHSPKHLTTHSLRHTFGTYCRAKGIPIQDIQVMMGHSSIRTTEIYAKMALSVQSTEQYHQIMGF
jgi:integrase/recombinase XerD